MQPEYEFHSVGLEDAIGLAEAMLIDACGHIIWRHADYHIADIMQYINEHSMIDRLTKAKQLARQLLEV